MNRSDLKENEYYLYNDRRYSKTELFLYKNNSAFFMDGTSKELSEDDIRNDVKNIDESFDIYSYCDWKYVLKSIKASLNNSDISWVTYPKNPKIKVNRNGYILVYSERKKQWEEPKYSIEPYLCFRLDGNCYRNHRIVAETFIKNPDPERLTFVNHKSELKIDNRVENLEWSSPFDNINYKNATFKMKSTRNNRTHYKKRIYQFSLDGKLIKIWENIEEIKNAFKIKHTHIYMCCRGKEEKAYGYKWRFEDEENIKNNI